MNQKRIVSGLLSVALLAAMAVPVGAAESSFTDVTDQTTAVNADILRLMGVVSGVGNDQFNPNASLTRAEFCTMVVKFLQRGDDVATNATRTIFSDVTAKHWALGYVNLAATIRMGEDSSAAPLISGVGDGRFEPDAKITLAQAATILLRLLGYTSQQTGSVWPQSYMNLAASIGLTDGVSAGYSDNMTRAQAAQLFVNALKCKTQGGTAYYKGLGTEQDKTIILAVNVTTDDGKSDGAIQTTASDTTEAFLPAAGAVKPSALVGKRGSLILNDKSEIVTFVPDDSTSVTVTLSGAAQASYLRGTDGSQYAMNKDTLLFTSDAREGKNYSDGYTALVSGTQVTMYSDKGKIVAVYASGSTMESSDGAVVVTGTAGTSMFQKLTGGVTNYTIQKNRQTISLGDIQPYDVVTYDKLNNVLIVSDLKLSCVYENAAPNAKAPTSITVLGHEFEALDSGWSTIQSFSLGDQVTLLLTADGKVAGMASPKDARSNAVGLVTGSGAELYLPNGGSVQLTGTVSNAAQMENQLAVLSSGSKGKISTGKLTTAGSSSTFQIDDMKLGSYQVAAGVRIFEQVNGGAVAEIDLSHLDMGSIPASKIAAYRLNSSGMVDYLVLNAVTGDAYQYGMMVSTTKTGTPTDDATEDAEKITTWSLVRGSKDTLQFSSNIGYSGRNGTIVGVITGVGIDGSSILIKTIETLTAIQNVTPSDFFENDGVTYVHANGRTYRVANDVECYRNLVADRSSTENWFSQDTGTARLNACKAFSDNLTIYVDPIGEKVRIVAAN